MTFVCAGTVSTIVIEYGAAEPKSFIVPVGLAADEIRIIWVHRFDGPESIALVGQSVLVLDVSGSLTCLSAIDRAERWTHVLNEDADFSGGVDLWVDDSSVAVRDEDWGELGCFRIADGSETGPGSEALRRRGDHAVCATERTADFGRVTVLGSARSAAFDVVVQGGWLPFLPYELKADHGLIIADGAGNLVAIEFPFDDSTWMPVG